MKENISILVVDDDAMMRSLLVKILQRDGYEVIAVEGGSAALEHLGNNEVDLVVTDMKMPEMDGFDLLKAIKKDYPDISVIMVTGYGDTYSVKDALLLGADEYVTKPFKSHEIAMVVERVYWRLVSRRQLQVNH